MEQIAGVWGKISSTVWGTSDNSAQAKSKFIDNYNEGPYCAICKEDFTLERNPRTLSCDHSFCLQCLRGIETQNVIKCPECKKETGLKDKGVNGLKKYKISTPSELDKSAKLEKSIGDDLDDAPFLSKSFVDVPLSAQSQIIEDHDEPIEEEEDESEKQDDGFVVLDNKPAKVIPSYYLPFTQQKELCKVLINQWISSIWFPPSDLNETVNILDSRPAYIPFYCFNVRTETSYNAEIGIANANGEIQWSPVHGTIRKVYDELMTCASYSVNRSLAHQLLIKPNSFSLNTGRILPPELPPYKADLSLPLSEEVLQVDIGIEDAFEFAAGRKKVNQWEEENCRLKVKQDYNTEKIRGLECNTRFKKTHFVILLPIYIGGFIYGGMNYEVVLSGNKGTIEGQRPFGSGMVGRMLTDAVKRVTKVVTETI